jgi:HAD superfamily hydrolase (TIGR01509 family)
VAPGEAQAVLWDMDGTLVDTEPYWIEAESELVATHGGTWTQEDSLTLVGSDLVAAAIYIRDHGGVRMDPPAIVEALLDGVLARLDDQVPWRPGAVELLGSLQDVGVPCALVTMSYQRFAGPLLRRLPEGAFSAVVTGDLVSNGKPHPEPYLTAASRLGVRPEHCLAIEDSHTGATSAEAAGCTVVVVENHVPVPPGERRIFLDTLVGVDPADLPALLSPTS